MGYQELKLERFTCDNPECLRRHDIVKDEPSYAGYTGQVDIHKGMSRFWVACSFSCIGPAVEEVRARTRIEQVV